MTNQPNRSQPAANSAPSLSGPDSLVVRLCHLYPREMNFYADRGNIAVLAKRLAWRGMHLEITECGPGEPLLAGQLTTQQPSAGSPTEGTSAPRGFDMFYLGGGQDNDQVNVAQDLMATKADALKGALADGAVGLFVCGGYQLAGHSYETADGQKLPGFAALDIQTTAGDTRLIGDILIESKPEPGHALQVAGYENHAGRTHLGSDVKPLGKVIRGHGNNGKDETEGAVQNQTIGTYLHGPLLPRNPRLADLLLTWALARRHPDSPALEPLNDNWEHQAHSAASRRAKTSKPRRGQPLRGRPLRRH